MRRYGEPVIERFGEGNLYGYSIMQLIHTSSITMHFSEMDNRAFIDIFSCKGYEPDDAATYCADYLGGHVSSFNWQFRD
jgi:S-adenosylmethionine/arginine decarboxylase-like enzyme